MLTPDARRDAASLETQRVHSIGAIKTIPSAALSPLSPSRPCLFPSSPRFFYAPKRKVMLASLMAAGTGVNLTSANHCFICDRESTYLELLLVPT